jgi:Na+/H+ antiporter NhaD/arsenite permease-like protein
MENTPTMLNAFFHIDDKVLALTIMIVTYLFLFSERINRAVVALLGAGAVILFGVLNQKTAISSIDFNTLNLLIGMMIIVSITEKSGVFQFIGMWAIKKVRANPRGMLAVMALITGLLSGYIDNVTTVLLMTPIIIQITKIFEVRSFPYLMMTIFACNIGGAATLIGDPPNILIGSHLKMTFMDFIYNMTPISYLLLLILIIVFDFIWGRKLSTTNKKRAEVLDMCAHCYITDMKTLKKSLSVLAFVIVAFIFAHEIHLETGTIAIIGASVLMLLYSIDVDKETGEERIHELFKDVDWVTIFFFAGLFVVVAGLEHSGVLEIVGLKFAEVSGGSVKVMMMTFLWVSAGASTVIDNIPFVATMIPIAESIEHSMGLGDDFRPIWWALLMGACYGGNGTIIASSANVVVAGIAAKSRRRIGFLEFMKWGVPVTIGSVAIASVYVYLKYLL